MQIEGMKRSRCIGEVKPSNKQRPRPVAELDAIPSIVTQSADYVSFWLPGLLYYSASGCSLRSYYRSIAIIFPVYKDLSDNGILRCETSAGETQNGPLRSFMTDLKLARVEDLIFSKPKSTVTTVGPQIKYNYSGRIISLTPETTSTHTKSELSEVVERGGGKQSRRRSSFFRPRDSLGTAQFMASEILMHVRYNIEHVVHEANYPISKKSGTSILPRFLAGDCCYHGYAEVEWGSLRDIQRIITEFMSAPPGHPFNVGFRGLVHVANTPRSPRSLTHDDMFKVVDSAISSLQSSTIYDGRRDRCTCSYHKRSTKQSKQVYLPFSY